MYWKVQDVGHIRYTIAKCVKIVPYCAVEKIFQDVSVVLSR